MSWPEWELSSPRKTGVWGTRAVATPSTQVQHADLGHYFDALAQVTPSPIVELNRAVAVGMAFGPAAGLKFVDELTAEASLAGYYLLPGVRSDLLDMLGRFYEARTGFEREAALARNAREREMMLDRVRECAASDSQLTADSEQRI
jgi:predicted RNA polymerase sigma factor